MKLVKEIAFEVIGAATKAINTPNATRHDVIAIGTDLVVEARTSKGTTATLGTVTAGTCGSYDFGCDQIQLSVSGGVGTSAGELRSYSQ